MCCKRNNFLNRHTAVQEGLACLMQEAGQGFSKEVAVPDCPDGQLRPADLLIPGWENGQDTAVDVTLVHGWQASLQGTSVSRERWRNFLRKKEDAKHQRYDVACKRVGWAFLGMAMGTWGWDGSRGLPDFPAYPQAGSVLARRKFTVGEAGGAPAWFWSCYCSTSLASA